MPASRETPGGQPRGRRARAPCPVLSAVPSTLRIPLAARAFGDALFPHMAVGDAHAAAWLQAMGDDGAQWLADRPSVYGVLARTRIFRAGAARHLARYPGAQLVNLGCGLSDYFQWLDDGACQLLETDLPEVVAIRQNLPLAANARRRLVAQDLRLPGWWDRLGLPTGGQVLPVFLLCEGVLMYLQPAQVRAVLAEIGERAPTGSVLMFDALCAATMGHARLHPSIRHTGAEFAWGPAHLAELTAPHARLQRTAMHSVMDGYAPLYALMGLSFQLLMGVPFYAVYALEVGPAAP